MRRKLSTGRRLGENLFFLNYFISIRCTDFSYFTLRVRILSAYSFCCSHFLPILLSFNFKFFSSLHICRLNNPLGKKLNNSECKKKFKKEKLLLKSMDFKRLKLMMKCQNVYFSHVDFFFFVICASVTKYQ